MNQIESPFSAGISDKRNLPLADQLAEIRSRIKLMKHEEKGVVAEIIEKDGDLGAFTRAIVSRHERRSLDSAIARRLLGDRAAEAERVSTVTQVKLEDIDDA
mgnify:CR=1 FL=1